MIAARAIAVRAVGRPDARTGSQTYAAGAGNQQTHVTGLPLGTRGGMVVTHLFPSDGEYQVNIADMFTHIWGNDSEFENTVVVTLDGKPSTRATLGGEEDTKAYDQIQNGVMEKINWPPEEHSLHDDGRPAQRGRDVPPPHVRRIRRPAAAVRAGRRPGPRSSASARSRSAGRTSRHGVSMTPSRDRIFSCSPQRGDDEQLCAEKILGDLAKTRVSPAADGDRSRRPARVLPRRPRGERLRGRHPQRRHRDTGEPVLPVSRGAACPRACSRGRTTASTTSRSPRSCRSSCGTRFPTTSCSISRCAASSARRRCCASRSRGC